MNKALFIPRAKINFTKLKHFKEKMGDFMPKMIDYSGNSINHYHNITQRKINKKKLSFIIRFFLRTKIMFYKILLTLFDFKYINVNSKKYSLYGIRFFKILNFLKFLYNKYGILKENNIEIKYLRQTCPLTIRRLARVFKKDIEKVEEKEKDKIIINPYYKFQLPNYPHIRYRFRRKLRKRLLIQYIRRKYKFIMFVESLSLHTFLGTKEVSYASLVKNNRLNLVKFLYQYKLKMQRRNKGRGKRLNFREKQFIQRPFKVAEMNTARFDMMDHSYYAVWYKKMENQLLKAAGQQTAFEL